MPEADATPNQPAADASFEAEWAAAEKLAENNARQNAGIAPKRTPVVVVDDTEDEGGDAEKAESKAPATPTPPEPSVAERVEMRRLAREAKSSLAKERAAAQVWLDEQTASIAEGKRAVDAFQAAVKAGDWDGLAKAAGYESWNGLNAEVLAHYQDPARKEVQKLRAEMEADRAKATKERETWAARQAEEAQQATAAQVRAAQTQYKTTVIAAELLASGDPALALAAGDPEFVEAVFAAQRESWDPDMGETISVAEAADTVIDSIRKSPVSKLRRDLLRQLIADEAAEEDSIDRDDIPEAPKRVPARGSAKPREKARPVTITQTAAMGPSTDTPKEMSHKDWMALAVRKLEATHRR